MGLSRIRFFFFGPRGKSIEPSAQQQRASPHIGMMETTKKKHNDDDEGRSKRRVTSGAADAAAAVATTVSCVKNYLLPSNIIAV